MLIALSGRVELNACVSPFPPRVRAGGCRYPGIWTSPVRVANAPSAVGKRGGGDVRDGWSAALVGVKQTFALRWEFIFSGYQRDRREDLLNDGMTKQKWGIRFFWLGFTFFGVAAVLAAIFFPRYF